MLFPPAGAFPFLCRSLSVLLGFHTVPRCVPPEFGFFWGLILARLTWPCPAPRARAPPHTHAPISRCLRTRSWSHVLSLSAFFMLQSRAHPHALHSRLRVPLSWSRAGPHVSGWACAAWLACWATSLLLAHVHVHPYVSLCASVDLRTFFLCTLKSPCSSSRARAPALPRVLPLAQCMLGGAVHALPAHAVSVSAPTPPFPRAPPSVCAHSHPLPRLLPVILCFLRRIRGKEMGAGLESCFQWIVAESLEQRKDPDGWDGQGNPWGGRRRPFHTVVSLGEGSPHSSINR